jgi:Domain of unknown function (DUF5615)
MRLLLDNNLSPRLVDILGAAGWDVVHVASLGLRSAPDRTVLEAARRDGRFLVSADTDFGALLASSHAIDPPSIHPSFSSGESSGVASTTSPTFLSPTCRRSRTTSSEGASWSSVTTHCGSDNCPSDDWKPYQDPGPSPRSSSSCLFPCRARLSNPGVGSACATAASGPTRSVSSPDHDLEARIGGSVRAAKIAARDASSWTCPASWAGFMDESDRPVRSDHVRRPACSRPARRVARQADDRIK